MTLPEKKIAFGIEVRRILELLADQIYQSPLALLRENTQNAFDAVQMRKALQHEFSPRIDVTVTDQEVTVTDNGIGMTPNEIEQNFWHAGKSGKNTEAARAAGVVGTFGIGALANFGVADELTVETESAKTGERTISTALKSNLSTVDQGISVRVVPALGNPGTKVRARLTPNSGVSIHDAYRYLHQFVEFVDVPVYLNDELLSGSKHRDALPSEQHAWSERKEIQSLAGMISGDLEVRGMATGEFRVVFENIVTPKGLGRTGAIVLQQDASAIRTLRSGFGLATVGARSDYRWGGVVDLPFLQPTAGREALAATAHQELQQIISALDEIVSQLACEHTGSLSNDSFLGWIANTGKYSICGPLLVTVRPSGAEETLEAIASQGSARYYGGRDTSLIETYASEEQPLVVLSRRRPRRDCEQGYLVAQGIGEIDDSPKVTGELSIDRQSIAHSALAVRIARILEEDYFLGVDIRYGSISGGLPLLVTDTKTPVVIFLDPDSTSVSPLLALYRDNFNAFGPFVKDFVRSAVFPRVSKLVPSSTRAGAEAFLRHLRANREWFEYELDDKADLAEILEELRAGRLTTDEAKSRLFDVGRSFVEVSGTGTEPLSTVVGHVEEDIAESANADSFDARPGIDRRDDETNALILTTEHPFNGYTCFLSLTGRVQREKGDFFLQPHTTEVVWGGRKVVFIFQHHSRRFGLYYDILCPEIVGETASGGLGITSTILTKGRTFIPIPQEIAASFLPNADERKRLEVRCDVLYLSGDDETN